jgi:hypothetical protein
LSCLWSESLSHKLATVKMVEFSNVIIGMKEPIVIRLKRLKIFANLWRKMITRKKERSTIQANLTKIIPSSNKKKRSSDNSK